MRAALAGSFPTLISPIRSPPRQPGALPLIAEYSGARTGPKACAENSRRRTRRCSRRRARFRPIACSTYMENP